MNILAIETSTSKGSLCLHTGTGELLEKSWERKKGKPSSQNPSHSELANGGIQELLDQAGLKLQDIDLLTTSIGPGSFTGIRVSLCIVKAYSMTLGIPIKTFDSLLPLAMKARDNAKVAVMQNAFKNQVFFAAYDFSANKKGLDGVQVLQKPQAIEVLDLKKIINEPFLVLGNGLETYKSVISPDVLDLIQFDKEFSPSPEAKDLVNLCLHEPDLGRDCTWDQVDPLYIRASEAEENLRSGRLKPLPKI